MQVNDPHSENALLVVTPSCRRNVRRLKNGNPQLLFHPNRPHGVVRSRIACQPQKPLYASRLRMEGIGSSQLERRVHRERILLTGNFDSNQVLVNRTTSRLHVRDPAFRRRQRYSSARACSGEMRAARQEGRTQAIVDTAVRIRVAPIIVGR